MDNLLDEEWQRPTLTQYGARFSLLSFLIWHFQKNPPQSPDEVVNVKISFDNASVTQSHCVKVEAGVVEDMRWATKKHTNGCHFLCYIGSEDRYNLEIELSEPAREIKTLSSNGKLYLPGEQKVIIKPYLVCDLVALCLILGLVSVFNHKSTWKCPWCLVTRKEIGDFSKSWPLRDFSDEIALSYGKKVSGLKGKTRYARTHMGINVSHYAY